MNRGKTLCQWCQKLYTVPGAYSTHLQKVHLEVNLISTGKLKRQFSDISNLSISGLKLDSDFDKLGPRGQCHSDKSTPITTPPDLYLTTFRAIVSKDNSCSDIQYKS